jgi:molybdate transport system substrate-binding protein
MLKIMRLTVLGCLALLLQSCGEPSPQTPIEKPTLLIYVGITMIQPMQEIAHYIEKRYNVNINLIKGGSKNLLQIISNSQLGDLYLPGSDSYIRLAEKQQLITDTVAVGYNQAALLVQKGNPKQLDNNLNHLTRSDLNVVIGNPDSSSVGKIAKSILEKHGSYQQVLNNVLFLTPDSKDITQALKDKTADLALSWYATAFWPENKNSMDAILIDEKYGGKKKLVIALLKSSKNPDIARAFMEYARSDAGQAIFRAYGF